MAAPQAPLTRLPRKTVVKAGEELRCAVPGAGVGLSCRGPGDLLHDGTGGGEGTARLT